jgi:hypothetical protein
MFSTRLQRVPFARLNNFRQFRSQSIKAVGFKNPSGELSGVEPSIKGRTGTQKLRDEEVTSYESELRSKVAEESRISYYVDNPQEWVKYKSFI